MIHINYPEPSFRIRKEGEKEMIFDSLRKRWVTLTEEEWVRQNFIRYLIIDKKYPATLIAIEKQLQLGELKKRFDVVVYDEQHQPWMMIECKAGEIPLDESVLQQLLRYHISIPVEYLVITNGKQCFAWRKKDDRLNVLKELPTRTMEQ